MIEDIDFNNFFPKKNDSYFKKFNVSNKKYKLISKEEISKEMKTLQVKFQKYRKNKANEIADLKTKRNRNIINFLNSINPIIEKYMADNSIYMLIDKKNVFIASKNYDITKKLIELIDNQIKTVDIK